HHIEMLADGRQLVVDGVHPATGKPYCWQGEYRPGDIAWEDLPEINEAEAHSLVALVSEMLISRFGFQETQGTNGNETNGPVDAEAELAAMKPIRRVSQWSAGARNPKFVAPCDLAASSARDGRRRDHGDGCKA